MCSGISCTTKLRGVRLIGGLPWGGFHFGWMHYRQGGYGSCERFLCGVYGLTGDDKLHILCQSESFSVAWCGDCVGVFTDMCQIWLRVCIPLTSCWTLSHCKISCCAAEIKFRVSTQNEQIICQVKTDKCLAEARCSTLFIYNIIIYFTAPKRY